MGKEKKINPIEKIFHTGGRNPKYSKWDEKDITENVLQMPWGGGRGVRDKMTWDDALKRIREKTEDPSRVYDMGEHELGMLVFARAAMERMEPKAPVDVQDAPSPIEAAAPMCCPTCKEPVRVNPVTGRPCFFCTNCGQRLAL